MLCVRTFDIQQRFHLHLVILSKRAVRAKLHLACLIFVTQVGFGGFHFGTPPVLTNQVRRAPRRCDETLRDWYHHCCIKMFGQKGGLSDFCDQGF
jgi:hypothetical protein